MWGAGILLAVRNPDAGLQVIAALTVLHYVLSYVFVVKNAWMVGEITACYLVPFVAPFYVGGLFEGYGIYPQYHMGMALFGQLMWMSRMCCYESSA